MQLFATIWRLHTDAATNAVMFAIIKTQPKDTTVNALSHNAALTVHAGTAVKAVMCNLAKAQRSQKITAVKVVMSNLIQAQPLQKDMAVKVVLCNLIQASHYRKIQQ